jgi:hypothetical protein
MNCDGKKFSSAFADVVPLISPLPAEFSPQPFNKVEEANLAFIRSKTAAERERLNVQIKATEVESALVNAKAAEIQAQLDSIPALVRVQRDREVLPWTAVDRAKVVVYIALTALMLLMSCVVSSNLVLKSGFLETRTAAIVFSGLPVSVPVVLESLLSVLDSETARKRYQICLTVVGVLCAFGWAICFVEVFGGGLSMNTADIINQISSGGGDAGNGLAQLMLALGLVSESLVAAAAWIALEGCFEAHSGGRMIRNPDRFSLEEELDVLQSRFAEIQKTYANLRSRLAALLQLELAFPKFAATVSSILSAASDPSDNGHPFSLLASSQDQPSPQARKCH